MQTAIRMVALTLVVGTSACARKHLTPAFGTANQEAFMAQRVRPPDARAPQPTMSLDPQETSVISQSYVRGLAGKTATAEPEPMLYVAPQQQGAPMQRLAPSVPHE